jgi:hypothetical protein
VAHLGQACGQRRLYQSLSCGEKGWSEAGKRVGVFGRTAEQLVERTRILGSHAYALAVAGIKAIYCVAERKQPAREFLEAIEMAAHSRRKAEASHLAAFRSPRVRLRRPKGSMRVGWWWGHSLGK